MKIMTVKDLKELIENLPDDMPILASEDHRPLTYLYKHIEGKYFPSILKKENIEDYYFEDESMKENCKNGFLLVDVS